MNYLVPLDSFLATDSGRTKIQHAYNRGEYKIAKIHGTGSWSVDGYACNEHGQKVYEFNGCAFHKGCPFCHPEQDFSEDWKRKMKEMKERSIEVEVMWECQFRKLLPSIQHISTPGLDAILYQSTTEDNLIQGIANGQLFGFLVCDIKCSETAIEKFHNYPPIVTRMTVTNDHLTNFMATQIKNTYKQEAFSRETLVQRYNAEQYLLFSPVAQFYLSNDIKLSNISAFYQYQPSPILRGFAEKVVNMRIDAEKRGDKTQSLTAKIFGNSGYGKMAESVSKYTKTIITTDEKTVLKNVTRPRFKHMNNLMCESSENDVHELILRQSCIKDSKPVHIAIAILQLSKLLMLKFVAFLNEFLEPGAFSLVYQGNLLFEEKLM